MKIVQTAHHQDFQMFINTKRGIKIQGPQLMLSRYIEWCTGIYHHSGEGYF